MGYSETRPSRFLLDVPQSLVLNMGAPQIRPVAFPQHQSTRYSHRDPFHQGDAPIDIDLPRSDGHSQDPGYQAESEPDSAARTGFAEGQRVSHGAFGDGSVLEVEPYAEAQRVTVIFDSGEKKVFLTKWAKLKVL